jgi:hypothetical protein
MTTTGDVAKGILIFCCGYYIFLTITQAIAGQTALAVLLLIGFMFPLSILIYGYVKDKRSAKSSKTDNINKESTRQVSSC